MPVKKSEDLFENFSTPSKAEWMAKVVQELRGKPVEELAWQLEENIELAPFYHPDEVEYTAALLNGTQEKNDWEIGEYITVSDVSQANKEVLEGLAGGVEAPFFRLKHELKQEELEKLVEGINFGYVSTHFSQLYPQRSPLRLLEQWVSLLKKRQVGTNDIRGSIDFDPFLDWEVPPMDDLVSGLKICHKELPKFQLLQVNASPFHGEVSQTSRELAYTIAKGSEYLAQLADRGLSPELVLPHLQFSVAIGTSFFVEIAKLRALRLLWSNVIKAYQANLQTPMYIVGHFALQSQTKNPHQNMIRAATQAMSGVFGGVDRLIVLPSNMARQEPSTAFSRRIARNVQHILKMESYLDRVIDPAAGSYYVETLTDKLATAAWEQFCEIEKAGGFMDFKG
ncbi:MAG: hypothetical protein DHS20C18_51780 [Saprospiraceae bacterium]|nr:MAG: hypothetical protein DHS20C18_51780 [Saprospiraceae bacterium]